MHKIRRGSGFAGCINYCLGRDPDHTHLPGEIIGGNMSGTNALELSHEFSASRVLRPSIEKPVWHNSLRLPAGEHVSPEKLSAIADDYMQRMGFSDMHQRIYIMHNDIEGQHVHVVASRIGLDGSLYLGKNENLISTRIIQNLEIIHCLKITKGQQYNEETGKVIMPKRSQLKKGEVEKAMHTGERPIKLQLQESILVAMQDKPTPQGFVKRLETLGITAIPNVASTGKMNGFSFEKDGVAYKASQLGDVYKWQNLEKGIDYEQIRDSAFLTELRRNQTVTGGDSSGSHVITSTTGNVENGHQQDFAGVRLDQQNSAPESRCPDARNDQPGIERIQNRNGEINKSNQQLIAEREGHKDFDGCDGIDRKQDMVVAEKSDKRDNKSDTSNITNSKFSERRDMEIDSENSSGWDSGRANSSDWRTRFKQASAARRRAENGEHRDANMEQFDKTGKRIAKTDLREAREIDPTHYLVNQGFEVKKEGRHLSVREHGDEVYRITRKDDGHYVACDNFGNGIGDNIALVQDVASGTKFTEAVFQLAGNPSTTPRKPLQEPVRRAPPQIPEQFEQTNGYGRQYLQSRGIDKLTIESAEKAGMVRYAAHSVLFVGYDLEMTPQNITRRSTSKNDVIQKRDLKGSDKRFPPILSGNPNDIWIVEGGTDALALQSLSKRQGKLPPAVIISGGSNVRSFLDNQSVQEMLKKANSVTVALEVEKDAATQEKTDSAHQLQIDKIAGITCRPVMAWKPPAGKDIADFNKIELETEMAHENAVARNRTTENAVSRTIDREL